MQYVFRSYFSYGQNISKVDIIPISFINEELGGGPQRRGKGLLRGPALIATQSEAKLASCLLRLSYVADSVWDVKTS